LPSFATAAALCSSAGDDATPTLTLVNDTDRIVRRLAATECFRLEVEQFNRAIEGWGEPMTSPEDGLRALAIGEALYNAVRTGRVTKVAEFMPKQA
jgi:predicted dehydrogenase